MPGLRPQGLLAPLDCDGRLLQGSGGWALLIVCAFVFAETGLLVGFVLPGDTLLIITGVLTFADASHKAAIPIPIWPSPAGRRASAPSSWPRRGVTAKCWRHADGGFCASI